MRPEDSRGVVRCTCAMCSTLETTVSPSVLQTIQLGTRCVAPLVLLLLLSTLLPSLRLLCMLPRMTTDDIYEAVSSPLNLIHQGEVAWTVLIHV